MALPQYANRAIKDQSFASVSYIETEEELDFALHYLEQHNNEYYFRGINDARFQMFASSQRNWMEKQPRMTRFNLADYHRTIELLIRLSWSVQEVKDYMSQQSVAYNEFFILALMQHFGVPSPMIDFSTSVWKGLFFAVDSKTALLDNGTEDLSDYVSLYYIPRNIDWMDCTIQRLMQNAASDIEYRVKEFQNLNPTLKLNTFDVEANIRHALFRQFSPTEGNIKFLPVGGPATGRVQINIPILNFNCDYIIINDRLLAQEGLFVFNNTENLPLVELMNSATQRKIFHCFNIRKWLIPYVHEQYLYPRGVDYNSIYCVGDHTVDSLQQLLDKV